MSELVVTTGGASSLQSKIVYAEHLAQAGLLPAAYRKQPANLLLVMEQAEALGIPTMAAVNGVHVIDGKPTISAGLMSALVRRAGHKLRVTGDDKRAVAEIIRVDDPDFTFRSEWTLERAKQAGLAGKGSWSKYPAAMLKARAISEVCRDACEEALAGVHYTPEELGADVTVDADGDVIVAQSPNPAPAPVEDDVVDAELVEPDPQVIEAYLTDIATASTVDVLRDLYRSAAHDGVLEHVGGVITAKVAALADADIADTSDAEEETA